MSLKDAKGFQWDCGNLPHCQKHGMKPDEIESVFRGGPRIAPHWMHSSSEDRFVAIGRTKSGRAAFVVFTLRGDLIRPLSARYMHVREIIRYET
jgi:uncharacterized protein